MFTYEDAVLVLMTSTRLGMIGSAIATMEKQIRKGIEVSKEQLIEQPENPNVPIMLKLFECAIALIEAHQSILRAAELGMAGGMKYEQSETIQ